MGKALKSRRVFEEEEEEEQEAKIDKILQLISCGRGGGGHFAGSARDGVWSER